MIVADYSQKEGLTVIESDTEVTKEQEERLTQAIQNSVAQGWQIQTGHRFFLLEDFYETDFQKTSPGGIFRVRYFNLKDIITPFPESVIPIADQLRNKTWG